MRIPFQLAYLRSTLVSRDLDPYLLVSAIMIATSPAPRRRHTDLQPLATRPDALAGPTRRRSIQGQGSPLTKSTATLPSPSIIAACAYYLESASPLGPESNVIKRRRSLIQGHQVSRRHSLISTTGNLVSQLENFTFTSARKDLQSIPEGVEIGQKIKTEDDDLCMNKVEESTPDVQRVRKSTLLCGTLQEVLRQVPYQYTHYHLRDWGYAYLGNSQTADAFVNAVNLRRPSLALVKEEFQVKSSDLVTIRARVVPKAKERKPFLIQRQFNIDELRSSIPKSQISRDTEENNTPTLPRRSSRIRRSSAWQAGELQKQGPKNCRTPIAGPSTLEPGAFPIRKSH